MLRRAAGVNRDYFVYAALHQLVKHFPDTTFDPVLLDGFHSEVQEMFDESRASSKAHFAFSPRTDTPFWLGTKKQVLAESIRDKDARYRVGLPVNAPASDDAARYYANFEEEFRNFWNNRNCYCVFVGLDHLLERPLPRLAHMPGTRREVEEVFTRIRREQRQLHATDLRAAAARAEPVHRGVPPGPTGFDPDLRSFTAGFPTGVSIVTTVDTGGRPRGMTCTSLCSVSLDPPTVLVCLRAGSPTLEALVASGAFSINVLARHAEAAAALFASADPERFDRARWHLPAGAGGPHLVRDARAVADCRAGGTRSSGDHALVFGEVARTTAVSAAAPLLCGLHRFAVWPHR